MKRNTTSAKTSHRQTSHNKAHKKTHHKHQDKHQQNQPPGKRVRKGLTPGSRHQDALDVYQEVQSTPRDPRLGSRKPIQLDD